MARTVNLSVKPGTTLQSPKIFAVNETVPANITYTELMEGIDDGLYTLKSLDNKVYTGQVRERANAPIKASLVFDTTDDIMTFTVPASITATWDNSPNTFFYDVIEEDTVTGISILKIEGKIEVIPSITLGE